MRSLPASRQAGGQIIALVGEAGLGKSRLLGELRQLWQVEFGVTNAWRESSATPYDTARAYSLFRQRLRDLFGLKDGEPTEAARQKVADTLEGLLLAVDPVAKCLVPTIGFLV